MSASLVQKTSNTSLLASVAATFTTAPTQGNLLIAVVSASVGTGSISLSNSGWSTGSSIAVGAAGGMIVFYKVAVAGSDQTVTSNGTLAAFMDLQIFEYDGIDNASPLDKTASTADSGSAVTSQASGTTATLTQANELAFVAVGMDGTNGGGASWTNSYNGEITTTHIITADLITTATTATSSTGSWTTSARAAGVILTFFAETGDTYAPKNIIKSRTPVINWNHPLSKGLLFDCPMFENGGTKVADIVSGIKGTFTNSPAWKSDIFGPMYSGAGATNQYINFAINSNLDMANLPIFSFETYIYRKSGGQGGYGRIIYKGNTGWDFANNNGDGGYGMVFENNTGSGYNTWSVPYPTNNVWTHYVGTVNWNTSTTAPKIYANGVSQAITARSTPGGTFGSTDVAGQLWLGGRGDASNAWDGYISYVRIWNRQLSAQEVLSLYSNPFQIYRYPTIGRY